MRKIDVSNYTLDEICYIYNSEKQQIEQQLYNPAQKKIAYMYLKAQYEPLIKEIKRQEQYQNNEYEEKRIIA